LLPVPVSHCVPCLFLCLRVLSDTPVAALDLDTRVLQLRGQALAHSTKRTYNVVYLLLHAFKNLPILTYSPVAISYTDLGRYAAHLFYRLKF